MSYVLRTIKLGSAEENLRLYPVPANRGGAVSGTSRYDVPEKTAFFHRRLCFYPWWI